VFRVRWTDDGEIFEGTSSWAEVVNAMRLSMRLDPDPDIKSYMAGVKRRVKEWNGSVIRDDDPEHFIMDLAACGFIEILEGE
jgi:hypothetical protein